MPHTEAFKTNRQGAIISIEDIDKGEEKAQDLTIMKQNQDKSSRKTNKKCFSYSSFSHVFVNALETCMKITN